MRATCLWKVRDVRRLLLDCHEAEKTVYDAVVCMVADEVRKSAWVDMCKPEWHESLFKDCRGQAFKYGVELIKLVLIEMTKTKLTLRQYQS